MGVCVNFKESAKERKHPGKVFKRIFQSRQWSKSGRFLPENMCLSSSPHPTRNNTNANIIK